MRRRGVVGVCVAAAALTLAELAAAHGISDALDDRRQIDDFTLDAALGSFRSSLKPDQSEQVPAGRLEPSTQTRAVPERCISLVRLNTTLPADGGTWTGAAGTPLQPIQMLAVRYPNADQARAELNRKRLALLTCSTVRLTFPPFNGAAQRFRLEGRVRALVGRTDRLGYRLVDPDRRYSFYLRRYGNVLIWTYGDRPDGETLRRAAVDDLADRLAELHR